MIQKFSISNNPIIEKEVEDIIMSNTYTSEQRDVYLTNFKNNIVTEIHPDIKFGWIMPNGDIIGYIGEYDNHTCYHLSLAAVLCSISNEYDWDTVKNNTYQYLEEIGGLKFCTEYAITTKYTEYIRHKLSQIQEDMFIDWLIKAKIPYIALGDNRQNIFTTYNIKQMDSIMLYNHLSN